MPGWRRLVGLTLGAGAVVAAVTLAGTQASAPGTRPAAAAALRAWTAPEAGPSAAATSAAPAPVTPARTLKPGLSGADVTAMQQRLVALKYWLGSVTGTFNYDTEEAVYAFQAVNGLAMSGVVDAATGRALLHPRTYTPRNTGAATRIEVDINTNKQLLVYYKNHRLALITHISSGRVDHATTPTGTYTANIFMPGRIVVPLGVMYNPVFFIGTVYAIHGDTAVPSYPDSNGCIRIPIDLSNVFYKEIGIVDRNGHGTEINIYGSNWRTGT